MPWSAVAEHVAKTVVGRVTAETTDAVLEALLAVEDEELTVLNGLDAKVNILLDASFKPDWMSSNRRPTAGERPRSDGICWIRLASPL